jgi:uncharacterized membrane protein
VLAAYLRTPAAPAACVLYAGTFVLISIAFYLLILAAFRESALKAGASESAIFRIRKSYRYGPPLYLIAALAAPVRPWLCLAICTALWIFWAAMTRDSYLRSR